MTIGMRGRLMLGGLAAVVIALLAYAWIDGGRRPVENIAHPIPLPSATTGDDR